MRDNMTSKMILSFTTHPIAIGCIVIFGLSYLAVFFEERLRLHKSKPAMLGACLIWIMIGIFAVINGIDSHALREAVYHALQEYAALLLFLLSAMTYIAALQERLVFDVLRSKLIKAGFNLRQLFWITGVLAFCLSPVADNLTTALVIGSVAVTVGGNNIKFIVPACINIISAANAGGAFSPFGDITTLMVWQADKLNFFDFFSLAIPSIVNFLIPAFIMSFFIPKQMPKCKTENVHMKQGGKLIIGLGLCTIGMAIGFEQVLHLPAFLGMMMGLAMLMIVAWAIRCNGQEDNGNFEVLKLIASVEWDTLLFFFGVIFSIGGLGFLGYLHIASEALYGAWGAKSTNIVMGLVSAVIDNIPVMFAVLSMNPPMSNADWLLITLTTGVGGTLLSVGSTAGIALMGIARGQYTFFSHLKWTPVLLLGYIAAVMTHFLVNN